MADGTPRESELATIARLAPAAVIVRTDFRKAHDGIYHGAAQLEKATKRQRISLPQRLTQAVHKPASSTVSTFFGIPSGDADLIYLSLIRLAHLNPRASWCLLPEREEARPITESRARRFVDDLISCLGELMPGVGRIDADTFMQPNPRGHVQRRTFLRIHSLHDDEIAAIDTAHVPKHIRSLIIDGEEHQSVNRDRARDWADQFGSNVDDMPMILNDLHGLFFKAALQYVDLRDGTAG